jgi:hypothetical protein
VTCMAAATTSSHVMPRAFAFWRWGAAPLLHGIRFVQAVYFISKVSFCSQCFTVFSPNAFVCLTVSRALGIT